MRLTKSLSPTPAPKPPQGEVVGARSLHTRYNPLLPVRDVQGQYSVDHPHTTWMEVAMQGMMTLGPKLQVGLPRGWLSYPGPVHTTVVSGGAWWAKVPPGLVGEWLERVQQ